MVKAKEVENTQTYPPFDSKYAPTIGAKGPESVLAKTNI